MIDSVKFTDLDIPISQLLPGPNSNGPMNLNWIRVRFSLGNSSDSFNKVQLWLLENCPGRWAAYQTSTGPDNALVGIVRFEHKNDALMFKLQGGHQTWQD